MPQTLFPYQGIMQSAGCLRDIDLFHQCSAVVSILKGNENDTPIPGMWKGHLSFLFLYGQGMCMEYDVYRRVRVPESPFGELIPFKDVCEGPYAKPPWLGDPWVHRSHRSRLLSYDYGFYADKFPGNPLKMPLIWPRLDDGDERGYRLYVTPRAKLLLDRGTQFLPASLHVSKELEVIEE